MTRGLSRTEGKQVSKQRKINRRDFLQSTAQGAGALAGMDWYVRALLAGALVPSVARSAVGGGTGDPNFLFISLPGGYDPTLLFDPKLFHILRDGSGRPLTMNPLNNETVNNPSYVAPVARTELAPRPVVDALEYLTRAVLPGNAPDSGTHVYNTPPDYTPPERSFSELESTPPRFTRGEISLGPCAGPLLEYASRMTICRGVIPSTQHDTAVRVRSIAV
jgi:hypothetical protein